MRIDCHKCIYYFVTWESSTPHGCRGMGFKSWRFPSAVVRHIMMGKGCLLFTKKKMNNRDPLKPSAVKT
jgi:hypothetical protein